MSGLPGCAAKRPKSGWSPACGEICGKSYVHETVVKAFEEGVLEQFADIRGNSLRVVAVRLYAAFVAARSIAVEGCTLDYVGQPHMRPFTRRNGRSV
jgi:hypothetical protein